MIYNIVHAQDPCMRLYLPSGNSRRCWMDQSYLSRESLHACVTCCHLFSMMRTPISMRCFLVVDLFTRSFVRFLKMFFSVPAPSKIESCKTLRPEGIPYVGNLVYHAWSGNPKVVHNLCQQAMVRHRWSSWSRQWSDNSAWPAGGSERHSPCSPGWTAAWRSPLQHATCSSASHGCMCGAWIH